jgi:hypothetical protein
MPTVVLTVALETATDLITSAPWSLYGAVFPDRGGVPDLPQYAVEVLRPANVDGARYRTGGMHYPEFRLAGIIAASTYDSAKAIAREVEATKGRYIVLSGLLANSTVFCVDCVALANAKRVVGATGSSAGPDTVPGGGAAESSALASVDVMWTLQAVAP